MPWRGTVQVEIKRGDVCMVLDVTGEYDEDRRGSMFRIESAVCAGCRQPVVLSREEQPVAQVAIWQQAERDAIKSWEDAV